MPIRLLLEHDHLFEPEEIDSLILAFENTLRVLGLTNREDPLTVAVAKLIIQLAKDDERDPGRLRDASWRRSDAQLPLQIYRSYLDSFRRSDRGSNPLPPCLRPATKDRHALAPPSGGPGGKGKGARGGSCGLRAPLGVV